MNVKQKNTPSVFGLDIGIASVGWAVLGDHRIIDLGVRCFDKAEADKGESINLARRTARLTRRRLRRRAWRLTKLARLLVREGVIADVNVLKQPPVKGFDIPNIWQLRVDALDRKLNPEEWARVIYHLCKHRGFYWTSKAEEQQAAAATSSEMGKVKQALAGTEKLMKDNDYRTAAEMIMHEFPEAQRNKQTEYSKALSRTLLHDEFVMLFEQQRTLGNLYATEELQSKLLERKVGLFWAQKPALSGESLRKMLGKCTFERTEYRAPKASFTAERHVWLTCLNNLRIVENGVMRPLDEDERQIALPMPYVRKTELKYKQLKAALIKQGSLSENARFVGLSYPSAAQLQEKNAKDPEDKLLVKLSGFQALRQALINAGLETEWQGMVNAAMSGNPELLDSIAEILSVYKEDEEVERELKNLPLPNAAMMLKALQTVRFDKFSHLSLKALRKIVPHMEQGLRYDEACGQVGYHHSQLLKPDDKKYQYLPPFYSGREKNGRLQLNEEMDVPRNPVVLRALNQARKVVNALVKQYGAPYQVNIEMARDLSRSSDERREIEKEQEKYRQRNENDRKAFNEEINISGTLKGRDFEKWQLYREQQAKCAYSLQPLDLNRLFTLGYVEIDHALPYSRSFDNSKNNRVLVLSHENQNKGNQTPYEYLDGQHNSDRWRAFETWVNTNKAYRRAKQNLLLRKKFDEKEAQEFRERHLNDTRYICRFFKNYVERYLQLAAESEAKRCVVLSGQMTAFLRARWGLIKLREQSDRHHALDAAVVAACTHGMVKRISDYAQYKELSHVHKDFVDVTSGEILNPAMYHRLSTDFPVPWSHFRKELETRRLEDNAERMREELTKLGSYSAQDLAEIKPLLVSRAPQRRNRGAAHKDTIYGQPKHLKQKGSVTEKIEVTELTLKDFGEKINGTWVNCKLIEPHRNEKLYASLRQWVADRTADKNHTTPQKKAAEQVLPRKPTKDGRDGPIVRTVTAVIDKLSGIPVRGGVAKNENMLRVDVFSKAAKFYLVPVYVHHAVAKTLPDRAIIAGKNEDEWTQIDTSFAFCFSLYRNDFVKMITSKKEVHQGYYCGCDRSTGTVNLWVHDRDQQIGSKGLIRGIGVKNALSLEKFNVDVLGRIYPAPKEKRRGLA